MVAMTAKNDLGSNRGDTLSESKTMATAGGSPTTTTLSPAAGALANANGAENGGANNRAAGSGGGATDDEGRGQHFHIHSGLSALIQAATSQLGQLAEEAEARAAAAAAAAAPAGGHSVSFTSGSHSRHHRLNSNGEQLPRSRFHSITSSDDGASSDGGGGEHRQHRADRPTRTPTIVPEQHAPGGGGGGGGGDQRGSKHTDQHQSSFPRTLMSLALEPENADVITFLPDGKFFAVRVHDFVEGLMLTSFNLSTFEEFLDALHDWGFTRLSQEPPDSSGSSVEVFRHPKFIKGDWDRCDCIRFGESPTDVRITALPERAKIEYVVGSGGGADNSGVAAGAVQQQQQQQGSGTTDSSNPPIPKRRLSPSFIAKTESETSIASQKMKVEGTPSPPMPPLDAGGYRSRRESVQSVATSVAESTEAGDAMTCASSLHAAASYVSRTDELRSIALSITTEKLRINTTTTTNGDTSNSGKDRGGDQSKQHQHRAPPTSSILSSIGDRGVSGGFGADDPSRGHRQPHPQPHHQALVDRAVESATHTIVTDAIETLLRDEGHTKRTYLKHEKELSKSSLPGVVPISKQLFAASGNIADTASSASAPQQQHTTRKDAPPSTSPPVTEVTTTTAEATSSNYLLPATTITTTTTVNSKGESGGLLLLSGISSNEASPKQATPSPAHFDSTTEGTAH